MPNDPSVADDIGAAPMVRVLFCFCDEIATVDYASNDCFRADIDATPLLYLPIFKCQVCVFV